jgi:hypothetical protein
MRNKFYYLFITAAWLLVDFKAFAQPGSGGGVDDEDPPPVPVNQKLIYLAIAGALFAFFVYRRYKKLKTN